jgi:hypothetical protein
MTETINLHSEIERKTLFGRLILEHVDKPALVELTKIEGYDITAIEVDVHLNGRPISHVSLQKFLESVVERCTESACKKIGYYPFKDKAESKATELLDVKNAAIDNMADKVSSRIQELMCSLSSLEREARYFSEKLYEDVESKTMLRSIREQLRKGGLSEEDRAALLSQLEAMDLGY